MRLFIVALSVLCLVSVVYAAKVKFQGDVEAHLFVSTHYREPFFLLISL